MRRNRGRQSDQDGFTLVELLVGMILFGLVAGIALTTQLVTARTTKGAQQVQDANAEARDALDRLSRDLRQALLITTAVNPDGPGYLPGAVTAFAFGADYNGATYLGSDCVDGLTTGPTPPACPSSTLNPTDPMVETYCYQPASPAGELYLIPGDPFHGQTSVSSCLVGGAQPVLSGNVTAFEVYYRSNLYQYAGTNGITTWSDLDAAPAPVGDGNGVLDANELRNINSVVVSLTVSEGGHAQSYQTQIDLRNLAQ